MYAYCSSWSASCAAWPWVEEDCKVRIWTRNDLGLKVATRDGRSKDPQRIVPVLRQQEHKIQATSGQFNTTDTLQGWNEEMNGPLCLLQMRSRGQSATKRKLSLQCKVLRLKDANIPGMQDLG
jgi:hypothetical protein